MTIKKCLAVTSLVAAMALTGCSTAPKSSTSSAGNNDIAVNEEIDLVERLRERMKKGPVQRQERPDASLAADASKDSSSSPLVNIDPAKQIAAAAVAADYQQALQLIQKNQDDQALALLALIHAKAPTLSGPLVNKALIEIKRQQYNDAEQTLNQAIALNQNNPFAHNLRGVALREQGKFQDAKSAYETALAIDANYAKAHFNLGVLYELYMQAFPPALTHFEKYQALQAEPDKVVANWIVDLQKRTGVYKPPVKAVVAPASTESDTTESQAEPETTDVVQEAIE